MMILFLGSHDEGPYSVLPRFSTYRCRALSKTFFSTVTPVELRTRNNTILASPAAEMPGTFFAASEHYRFNTRSSL